MNVIDVPRKIRIVPNLMFPETPLPQAGFMALGT